MSYYQYWAKTSDKSEIHLLPYHNLDVAACVKVLLLTDPLWSLNISRAFNLEREEAANTLAFLFALHDVGKFGRAFQSLSPHAVKSLNKAPLKTPERFMRHDVALHWLFREALQEDLDERGILSTDSRRKHNRLTDLFVSVSGHHGYPTPYHRWRKARVYFEGADRRSRDFVRKDFETSYDDILTYIEDLSAIFGPQHVKLRRIPDFEALTWLVAGVGTLADWLGSGTDYFPFCADPMPLEGYWEKALVRAENAVRDSGIIPAPVRRGLTPFEGLLPPEARLRPLQEAVLSAEEAGLVIIEDAPGSGKTEAALAFARKFLESGTATGIYFALPTQVSSDAMFRRVRVFCESLFDGEDPGTLVLSHGAAHMSESFRELRLNSGSAIVTEWLGDNRKKSLLAQIGVGTVDQALISVLPKFHASLRQAGLARSILIVDEVHAYQTYQIVLLKQLLRWQARLGLPVILLSATLPHTTRQDLIRAYTNSREASVDIEAGYPLITYVRNSSICEEQTEAHRSISYNIDSFEDWEQDPRTYQPERSLSTAEIKASNNLITRARQGDCSIWFRNTVKDALLAYSYIEPVLGKDSVLLAHSRFTKADRLRIDNRALHLFGKNDDKDVEEQVALRRGKVVICTQVFQESLDLDFDYAISDLAPIDELLQRFGRVHRHARTVEGALSPEGIEARGAPHVSVLMPQFKEEPDSKWCNVLSTTSSRYVYPEISRLWETARMVKKGEWNLPADIRYLMESVYGALSLNPAGLSVFREDTFGARLADNTIARNNALNLSEGYHDSAIVWTSDLEDVGVPTRLGLPSHVWTLARMESGVLRPFEACWARSEVTLSQRALETVSLTPEVEEAIEMQSELRNDFRTTKWRRYLVLKQRGSSGVWSAEGVAGNGDIVTIEYDRIRGLALL